MHIQLLYIMNVNLRALDHLNQIFFSKIQCELQIFSNQSMRNLSYRWIFTNYLNPNNLVLIQIFDA